MLGGGKRLRPAFAYWGYRGAGGADSRRGGRGRRRARAGAGQRADPRRPDGRARTPGAASRRCTAGSSAGTRASRLAGRPAAFGDSAAILLGDLALVWSDELLHTLRASARPTLARARPVFDEMRTEVTVGQYLDVLTQATGDTSLERAGKVARYKSAKYTVERPLLLGAALAGAPPAVAGGVLGVTACRWARRSSCATTSSACSATRRRPASRPATTCARASGRT